jgi:hypothetical protein
MELFINKNMNEELKPEVDLEINYLNFKKICFIYNAIENGWTVTKNKSKYIFTKKHEGKKEVYLESYLQKFIEKNIGLEK